MQLERVYSFKSDLISCHPRLTPLTKMRVQGRLQPLAHRPHRSSPPAPGQGASLAHLLGILKWSPRRHCHWGSHRRCLPLPQLKSPSVLPFGPLPAWHTLLFTFLFTLESSSTDQLETLLLSGVDLLGGLLLGHPMNTQGRTPTSPTPSFSTQDCSHQSPLRAMAAALALWDPRSCWCLPSHTSTYDK